MSDNCGCDNSGDRLSAESGAVYDGADASVRQKIEVNFYRICKISFTCECGNICDQNLLGDEKPSVVYCGCGREYDAE